MNPGTSINPRTHPLLIVTLSSGIMTRPSSMLMTAASAVGSQPPRMLYLDQKEKDTLSWWPISSRLTTAG